MSQRKNHVVPVNSTSGVTRVPSLAQAGESLAALALI